MALAFIGLGSNLGEGRRNLQRAWRRLRESGKTMPLCLSSPYLSEPVGMASEQWFTNAVGLLETKLEPEALLAELLRVETEMGRDRAQGVDRIIDLDLLYYDDRCFQSEFLTLPHPELANRLFVLAPLEELAPDHLHPRLLLSSRQLRQRLAASGQGLKKVAWGEGD